MSGKTTPETKQRSDEMKESGGAAHGVTQTDFRCGRIAIVGRPNVGKSTLLNQLVGQKVSITASKPQTTRHRILGIQTRDNAQLLFVDTPGLQIGVKHALGRIMNRAIDAALVDVDVILMVCVASRWEQVDQELLDRLSGERVPILLAINQIDRLRRKAELLPYLAERSKSNHFAALIPISARSGDNLTLLEQELIARLPIAAAIFPEDAVTDRSMRFLAAELVREQLVRLLGDELPYQTSVEVERFEEAELFRIHILIWVERASQRAIIIGEHGARLKEIGTRARLAMEENFQRKIFLRLWVKVRSGWVDDERALWSLGYDQD